MDILRHFQERAMKEAPLRAAIHEIYLELARDIQIINDAIITQPNKKWFFIDKHADDLGITLSVTETKDGEKCTEELIKITSRQSAGDYEVTLGRYFTTITENDASRRALRNILNEQIKPAWIMQASNRVELIIKNVVDQLLTDAESSALTKALMERQAQNTYDFPKAEQ